MTGPDVSTLASADEALFRPVRTGNAFEETVERLLQAIKLGVAGPGERLPAERELATKLNISRVTLREAIRALQEAGYVESRRGRYGGTFVNATIPEGKPAAQVKAGELDDVLTMRRVLEVGAAESAAARTLTPADRAYLRDQLTDARTGDLSEYRRKDSRLHLAIAEVAASPTLTSAVADVRVRLNELLDAIPLLDTNIDHSNDQHAAIVEKILAGDSAGARDAMAEHLDGTASLLRGFLS
ncbi:DNA-binding FadR family transcriptional regulator [Kibdelosporangium banguiense]|uniref:DNA-binding FadR family transcriptional regulator n=1 Tax=Kibdelosporangium banguiense TaxID=1365924 RepID=A0ABS4TL21_9PSEU|nr:FCD domain-containing protein [Kibdelosporangium banguiense]MBP2324699.1 DNA-binding FadR family transcriptional regulator [Kibdelosporangium banguiense]